MAPDPREQLRLARERRRREQSDNAERWREDTMEMPAVPGNRPVRARGPRLAGLTVLGLAALLGGAYVLDGPGSAGNIVTRTVSQLGFTGSDRPADRPVTDGEQAESATPSADPSPTPEATSAPPSDTAAEDAGRAGPDKEARRRGPGAAGPGERGPGRGGPAAGGGPRPR